MKSRRDDRISREYPDAKALCGATNPWPKRLTLVRFVANSADRDKRATIRFWSNSVSPIRITIRGPEAVVERLRDDLLDLIEGTRPWYDRAARLYPSLFVLILASAVFGFYIHLAVKLIKAKLGAQPPAVEWTINGVWWGTSALLGAMITMVYSWLFPVGCFTIGQAAAKYQTLEMIRWTVVIGFLVSVAGSVAMLGFS